MTRSCKHVARRGVARRIVVPRAVCAVVAAMAAVATFLSAPAHAEPVVSCVPAVPRLPDAGVIRTLYATATAMGASPKVMLAAFEAGLVESNLNNCSNGDRDSVGVFQQRASWGTFAQRTDIAYASRMFLSKAIAREHSYSTSGRLAQAVQVSAFPSRYDAREAQARQLIANASGGSSAAPVPVVDGAYVSYRGNAYRIAGGAPLFVSDWSHMGGDPGRIRVLTDAEWAGLRQIPVDGTLVTGSSPGDPKHGTVYVITNGAPIPRTKSSEVSRDAVRIVLVDLAAITNAGGSGVWAHLNAPPASDDTDPDSSDHTLAVAKVPAAVATATFAFPARRTAVVSWTAPTHANSYRVRVSRANATRTWRSTFTVTAPSARMTGLIRGATYRVQITAVGADGSGPTSTLRFVQRR